MIKDFLTYIVKGLVDNPDAVIITEIEGEKACIIEIKVAQDDIGRVIGKQGKVIKSIRVLSNAVATKINKRVTVEVIG